MLPTDRAVLYAWVAVLDSSQGPFTLMVSGKNQKEALSAVVERLGSVANMRTLRRSVRLG